MKSFTKKQRDVAMRILCDFYADEEAADSIDVDDLYHYGLPSSIDAKGLVYVLGAMGYVEITRYYNAPSSVHLTDKGKCYFERNADIAHEKRMENIRYIITTAIAVIALIKSFLPEISEVLGRIFPPA